MSTIQLLRLGSIVFHQEGAPEIECAISRDGRLICEFLGVPLLNVYMSQYESHEEISDIAVNHRFFHIFGMITRLEELEFHLTPDLAELQILREFMTWWINVKSKTNFKGPKCFTYEEVTQECLSFSRINFNYIVPFRSMQRETAHHALRQTKLQSCRSKIRKLQRKITKLRSQIARVQERKKLRSRTILDIVIFFRGLG